MLFLEFLPHPLGRLHTECLGIANLVFDQFKVGPATTGQNCFGGLRVLRLDALALLSPFRVFPGPEKGRHGLF